MKVKFAVATIALLLSVSSSAFAGFVFLADEDAGHGVRYNVKTEITPIKN